MGERKLICTIDINDIIDINAADYIIRDIKNKASNEQWQFPIILRNCKWLDSDIVRVKFMILPFELEKYCDFSVDNEGNGHASVYASERIKKELTEEEPNMIYKYASHKFLNEKEIEGLEKSITEVEGLKKTITEARSRLMDSRLLPVNEKTEDNKKDFEYICDRCGVRVKTPNTLRGPVNVVDFYREVEDEVGDSVSYKLCQDCMQDFFGFLSYNS